MSEDLGLVWLHIVSPTGHGGRPRVGVRELGQLRWRLRRTSADLGSTGAERSTRANLNGGREARFEDWIHRSTTPGAASLNFKHTLLPHVPWQYLPDGAPYRRRPNDPIPGLSPVVQGHVAAERALQRHFLQTGFADHELSDLCKHLKRRACGTSR